MDVVDNAGSGAFEKQIQTLKTRSAATMNVDRPPWLTRPYSTQGPLNKEELDHFFQEGYLIKRDVFPPSELQPVMDDIDSQVDAIAHKLLQAGRITDVCPSLGFYRRMAAIETQCPGASILLHKNPDLPPSFRALWSDPRLLDIAQQLLGGPSVPVAGHPVWNLRVKVPQTASSVVPWHQDAAYLDPEAAATLEVTAWIPFLDANAANGCLQVMRRAHQSGRTARHTCCVGGTWYVEMDLDDASSRLGMDCRDESFWDTCEVPLGSVLFLSNLIPHRSLPNVSAHIRWSIDLRWQDAREPAGFWGIKDMVLMREGGKEGGKREGYLVDWDGFLAVDRGEAQSQAAARAKRAGEGGQDGGKGEGREIGGEGESGKDMVLAAAAAASDALTPVISGPWMLRWDLVHHNAHTAGLEGGREGGREAGPVAWHKA